MFLHGWLASWLPMGIVATVWMGLPASARAAEQPAPVPGAQAMPPPSPPSPQTPAPAAPVATRPQPAPTVTAPAATGVTNVASPLLVFGSETGIVINPIKPDKAADYEALLARLQEALQQSSDPVRRSQAASSKS